MTFPLTPNLNKDGTQKSYFQSYLKYCGTSKAPYRELGIIGDFLKIGAAAFRSIETSASVYCEKMAPQFGKASNLVSLVFLPGALTSADAALRNYSKQMETAAVSARKTVETLKKVTDASALTGVFLTVFTENPVYKTLTETSGFIGNFAEMRMSSEDWSKAKTLAERAISTDVRDTMIDVQRFRFMKGLKATCGVAIGIFAYLAAFLGGPLVPALAIVVIGLASKVFDMQSDIFKDTCRFELPDISHVVV